MAKNEEGTGTDILNSRVAKLEKQVTALRKRNEELVDALRRANYAIEELEDAQSDYDDEFWGM